ncbi:MAG: hypothetical protein ACLUFI_05340 [Oscillospiraceae bacterium]
MTKLEEKLLAQIRARLAELDVRASDKLAALLPALRKLTEGYAALGAAAEDAGGPHSGAGGAHRGGGGCAAMSAGQMTAFSALVSVCSGLGSIVTLLVLLAKPVRERLFGMSAIREGQKCMLRADMLATYYKHREEKTIRQYEYENYLYEYKAYKALRGNSFIDRIAQEIAGWEIVT